MKFGSVPDTRLKDIRFTLPPEPAFNAQVLKGSRPAEVAVYLGAARWGDISWTGKVYPPKTPATRYREIYPQHFNAIELNATHYTIYDRFVIKQWSQPAKGRDFKFCPKFPQQISHYSNFKNAGQLTTSFIDGVSAFEENLGPLFLQLSEYYAPQDKDHFYTYLASLPKQLTYFVEVRHPAWLAQKKDADVFFQTLRTLGIGAIITDTPGRRDLVHMHLPISKLFLRFVCNALHPTSFTRTNDWIRRISYWIEHGLEQAYIFLHPGDDSAIPELATYWTNELNKHCRLSLTPPQPIQPTLF